MDIQRKLVELSEENYRRFQEKLIPQQSNILGVRIPILRKLAKEIVLGDWQEFLLNGKEDYFEEVMLKGIVIGIVKVSVEEKLEWIRWFVPKINNWAVCDSFCVGLKITKKHSDTMWGFIQPYLQSNQEFEIRFGVVMILSYFIEEKYLSKIFYHFNSIKHDGYYVKMAIAWAISMIYIHFPEETKKFLLSNELDDFTYNKSLQKIIESYRIDKQTKEEIRKLKRNAHK